MEAQSSTDPRQLARHRRRSHRAPLALAALLALLVLCGLCGAAAPAPADASVFTPFAASVAPSVTVTAPTGTTTHAQGSDLAVAWTSTFGGEFGLWARSSSGGWYAATLVSAGAGSTSTWLTLDVPPGSGYKAIVAWRPNAGFGAWQSWGTSPGSFSVTGFTADLTSLELSGSPANYTFAPATYAYSGVTVPNAVTSVTVTPTGAGVITVDGTTVTSGSASGGIALTAGIPRTITVVATETGKSARTYTITVTSSGAQATPTFSPAAGSVAEGTLVTITSAGADTIYYTTNGTTPKATSPVYDEPVAVSPPMTLKAFAVKAGADKSAVGRAAYTLAATPDLTGLALSGSPANFTFAPATYGYTGVTVRNAVNSVKVTPTGAGVITVDGTTVASGSASAAIILKAGIAKTIKIKAKETGKIAKTYDITVTRNTAAQATPSFSPAAGSVTAGTLVTITSAGADRIYYTTDGSSPNRSSGVYSAPVPVNPPMTLKALAVKAGADDSAVGSAAYTPLTITVTAPTGSATYAQGSVLTVAWTTSLAAPVGGEFSVWARIPGGTWYGGQLVAASGLAAYSTALTLDMPLGSGYQALVGWRPTAGSGDWVTWGVSPGSFTVASEPSPGAAKAITAFSFPDLSPPVIGVINESAHTIALTVPKYTYLMHRQATFTTTGSSVKVGSTVQVSGETWNDFRTPVTYTVVAADGSTQDYVVTVTEGT
jgi:hypothetical protein